MNIVADEWFDIGHGLEARVELPYDQDMGPPWKEHDGHGVVTEWTTREKRPGERVLCRDFNRRRYYDFAGAVEKARREEWGDRTVLAKELGREPTAGELAVWAVEADFERLEDWCDDGWHWIGVVVKIRDADEREVYKDSLWGIEDDTDYWKEVAAECIEGFLRRHVREKTEAQYWAERGVLTSNADVPTVSVLQ